MQGNRVRRALHIEVSSIRRDAAEKREAKKFPNQVNPLALECLISFLRRGAAILAQPNFQNTR